MEEVPFEDRVVPKTELDWGRSFWWWYPISRAIHPAIRMSSLLLSAVASLVLYRGIVQAEVWFSPSFQLSGNWWEVLSKFWQPATSGSTTLVTQSNASAWLTDLLQSSKSTSGAAVTNYISPTISLNNVAYLTFVVVWVGLVGSFFGGILSRRAAVELGQRTVAPWFRSLVLVASRLIAYFWAAGMHIVGLFFLLTPIVLLGWIARLGTTAEAIASTVLLVICTPLIFAVGRLLLSLLVCLPLSICAISIEKRADAFEGFSRSNAYLFQRPVVAVLCILLLVLVGEIGALLVNWTVGIGWGTVRSTFVGAGALSATSNVYLTGADWLAATLVWAYRFSFFWAASSALYLVLRKCVDNTDLEEMDLMESEIERHPPEIPTQAAESSEAPSDQSTTKTDNDEGQAARQASE